MSLLDRPTPPANAALQRKITRLKQSPFDLFNMLHHGWVQNMQDIWLSPDPQAVIDGLGTSAVEMFTLSQATVAFLETLKPGCTLKTLSMMRPFTANEDGTITVTPA